jgi:hypothetical protein
MKVYLLAALALVACTKKNDVHVLQEEAVSLVKYYQPRLDKLDARLQAVFAVGSQRNPDNSPKIPGNLPGIEDVGRRLQEARDTIIQLRGAIGNGPDGKSAVEKQAEALAKDSDAVVKLQKLVHETEAQLDRGMTIVNDDIDSAESWLANFDRKTLALNATAPAPTGQNTEPTGQPEAAPQPGQPPAAPQQAGSAAPPAQGSAAPAEKPKQPAKEPAPKKQPAPKP